ncbi:MAG: hypothetical protein ACTH4U_12205 [Pseudoalteromonas prydzensis]|uniref:hypothetical protein n=1 Tax=Pseudoalteromonas TaxID=53246 RepID=UPI0039FC0A83
MPSMLKNIFFIIACVFLVVLAWGIFQLFGKYAFLIMLLITVAVLIAKVGKPKFSNKK